MAFNRRMLFICMNLYTATHTPIHRRAEATLTWPHLDGPTCLSECSAVYATQRHSLQQIGRPV
jgi:hypothetical protein